jgi:hypothetical protein
MPPASRRHTSRPDLFKARANATPAAPAPTIHTSASSDMSRSPLNRSINTLVLLGSTLKVMIVLYAGFVSINFFIYRIYSKKLGQLIVLSSQATEAANT